MDLIPNFEIDEKDAIFDLVVFPIVQANFKMKLQELTPYPVQDLMTS